MLRKTFSVALCAAALSVCATVQAQWPIRYNNSSFNGDDEAFAVAVDRRGNVYTAGKSWGGTNDKFDFLVDSYDAAGFRRSGWPRVYKGPGNGDDIATSIHVDPASGNVYVGGTSYGGTTSGFDFCVIAYDSNGIPIWPSSGGAGTGYVYHLGALRSTSTLDEGGGPAPSPADPGTAVEVHVSMAVREDYSAENRVIAMTGIIAYVDVENQTHYWRTVVFEPGSAFPHDPVRKEGWPVDINNATDHDEIPEAVAIHTDNSVYVTGTTSPQSGVQNFTTIRYKPTGGNNPEYWRHDWNPPPANKAHSGIDIVLDRVGDAYATGYVTHDGLDYGTVAIRKDADAGGNPQVKWDHIWASDFVTNESAKSISLTFEVENGALLPFVYVTGTIGTSGIATLRYRSDYNGTPMDPVWEKIYPLQPNPGVAFGLDVVGAGYGNAYVIGGSNNDLIVLGYKRDSTERFAPAIYNNGGVDEGRMGVMVGAGALVGAGASAGTTTLLDFVSQKFAQSTTPSSPSSYVVRYGLLFSGGLSDLTASDDSYMVFRDNTAAESDPSLRVEFAGSTTVSNPTEICVNFEGKSDVPSSQEIEAYDWLTSSWVLLDKRGSTGADSRLTLVIKDDPGRFLNAGVFKVRIAYRNTAAEDYDVWKVSFDLLSWDVLGG